MFRRQDRVVVGGIELPALLQGLQSTMHSQAIVPFGAASPGGYVGMGPGVGYGVRPKVSVHCYPMQGGTVVDIELVAEVDSSSMVLGILLLVVFWPIAVILGVLAHQAYERYASQLLVNIRSVLAPYMQAASPPFPIAPPPGWR
jgi:hypothetical protein